MKQNIHKSPSVDLTSARAYLNQLYSIQSIVETSKEDIDRILDRFDDNTFQVAVVGEFSSGKSTFLNALIQRDILSHGRQETTAAVTKIVNTSISDPKCNTCVIEFENSTNQRLNSLEELKEYTTVSSTKTNVAENVRCVTVYTYILDSAQPVVFVDTPGLNGIADRHRDRTVELVKSAHACIYIMQARDLSQTDCGNIQMLAEYQSDFIFVQNHIDTFSKSEGDSVDAHIEKQRRTLEEKVFTDFPNVRYSICGVSSLKALAAKDLSIEKLYRKDDVLLSNEQRARLYEESCFESVQDELKRLMDENALKSLQKLDSIAAAMRLIENVSAKIADELAEAHVIWENSSDAAFVKRVQSLIDDWKNVQQRNCDSLANLVSAKFSEELRIIVGVGGEIEKYIEEFKRGVNEQIDKIKTIEDRDEYVTENRLTNQINNGRLNLNGKVKDRLHKSVRQVQETAVARVREYANINISGKEPELAEFKLRVQASEKSFESDKQDIDVIAAELSDEQSKAERLRREAIDAANRKQQSESEKSRLESEKSQVLNQREAVIRNLGSRPSAQRREYQETVTVERPWWQLGKIGDFFVGEKTETRYVPYYDYTDQTNWDNRKANYDNEYNQKIAQLQEREARFKNKIAEAEEDRQTAMKGVANAEEAAAQYKEMLEAKQKKLAESREKTTREYIDNCKNGFRRQIEEYAGKELSECLKAYVEQEVESLKPLIVNEIIEQYKIAAEAKRGKLQERINNRSNDRPDGQLEKDLAALISIKDNLQQYL
ncbi:hypothetical protein FACS1894216_01990 [Synergistales bacterium]|nr:hypothetical protein FACS1894216_01990 [Synergistales bacterium]